MNQPMKKRRIKDPRFVFQAFDSRTGKPIKTSCNIIRTRPSSKAVRKVVARIMTEHPCP